jgi:hypothetical protein
MTESAGNTRIELFRKASVLQLKLLADGFRDALLIPISFAAALIGLIRGGDDCEREFQRVLDLGRRSERWINLFGQQEPLEISHPAGSMDIILNQVESIVMEQYRKGKSASDARDAVREAMKEHDDRPAGKDAKNS